MVEIQQPTQLNFGNVDQTLILENSSRITSIWQRQSSSDIQNLRELKEMLLRIKSEKECELQKKLKDSNEKEQMLNNKLNLAKELHERISNMVSQIGGNANNETKIPPENNLIRQNINEEEKKQKNPIPNQNRSNKKRCTFKCEFCNQRGHCKECCFKIKENKQKQCRYCHKSHHEEKCCKKKMKDINQKNAERTERKKQREEQLKQQQDQNQLKEVKIQQPDNNSVIAKNKNKEAKQNQQNDVINQNDKAEEKVEVEEQPIHDQIEQCHNDELDQQDETEEFQQVEETSQDITNEYEDFKEDGTNDEFLEQDLYNDDLLLREDYQQYLHPPQPSLQQKQTQQYEEVFFANLAKEKIFPKVSEIPQSQKIDIEAIKQNPQVVLQKLHPNDIEPADKQSLILGLNQLFEQTTNMKLTVTNAGSLMTSITKMPLLSSMLSTSAEIFSIKIKDYAFKNYAFVELQQDPNKMFQFQTDMKKNIAVAFKVHITAVHIIEITQGSIEVMVVIDGFNSLVQTNHPDKIDTARRTLMANMRIHDVDVSKAQMTYVLNVNDFDSRGNFIFQGGDIMMRGGEKYYQPKAPWTRIGISVIDKYPKDGWLDMNGNPNEWAVAFHGVHDPTGYAFSKIVLEGLKIGPRQAYENNTCKRSGKPIGRGIYCTPKIEIAEGYTAATNLNGQHYKYIFQCRVRPSAIRDCGGDYWVINSLNDIRPYGVCIKK